MDNSTREMLWEYLTRLQNIYHGFEMLVRREAKNLQQEGLGKIQTFSLGNIVSLRRDNFIYAVIDCFLFEGIHPEKVRNLKDEDLPEMKKYVLRVERFLQQYISEMPKKPKELAEWLEKKD